MLEQEVVDKINEMVTEYLFLVIENQVMRWRLQILKSEIDALA